MATEDESLLERRAKFAVIHGASEKSSQLDNSRHLVSVMAPPPAQTRQLGLPGVYTPSTGIFSLPFTHLTDMGLSAVIQRSHPSHVVDLRVAPTFVPIASRTADFVRLLANEGISYVHAPEISNRYAGDAWHPERLRERFARRLQESIHILEEISKWALAGAVLVISADPQTEGSDREIFADEIRRIASSVSWREI